MVIRSSCLALSIVFASATWADSPTAPNIIGTWKGVSHSAVWGAERHHPAEDSDGIRFRHIGFTFVFDRQEGRVFAGKIVSAEYREAVLGSFSADLRSGVMVDTDGQYTFKIIGKRHMDVCYTHTGEDKKSRVAACYEVYRQ
jgi:hypothetical protein